MFVVVVWRLFFVVRIAGDAFVVCFSSCCLMMRVVIHAGTAVGRGLLCVAVVCRAPLLPLLMF